MTDHWDNNFHLVSPAFSFIDSDVCRSLQCIDSWPQAAEYNTLFHHAPYQFQSQNSCNLQNHGGYEGHIQQTHSVPTRENNWHDFFNALMWHHWPQSKIALNELQCHENTQQQDQRNNRSEQQNILTRFDESGAVCFLPPLLAADLRSKSWHDFFYHNRQALIKDTDIYIFGHGLFEKCINPYIGLCAHALIIEICEKIQPEEKDQLLRNHLKKHTVALYPLPLLGLPQWHVDNEKFSFYDNTDYFRT